MTEKYWKLGMILVIPLLLILWWDLEDTVGPEFVSKIREQQSE